MTPPTRSGRSCSWSPPPTTRPGRSSSPPSSRAQRWNRSTSRPRTPPGCPGRPRRARCRPSRPRPTSPPSPATCWSWSAPGGADEAALMAEGRDPLRYFRVEARDLVDQISAGVLDLDQRPVPEPVGRLLRAAHTLKGAARVVKHKEIADRAHAFEEILVPHRTGVGALAAEE